MRGVITLVVLLVAMAVLADSAMFIVDEREQVVVTQLGEPVDTIREPGLNYKIPFIQQLHIFDDRLLYSDAEPAQIYTQDKKNLIVDNYARWRIVDPLQFLVSVQSVAQAQSRLDDIIYSAIREELGQRTLVEIVSTHRQAIMDTVTVRSRASAISLGIEILDVRIKRADLPRENKANVFDRMKAERSRTAKEYRAEGEEAATKIRAETDLDVTRLTSEAFQNAQLTRGEGDAEALRIYAEAFQQDPKFYEFVRTLEAYEKTLTTGTTIVLPPSSDFFKYLGKYRSR
ncbi:MAG: membrane protease subunit HflC [Candidatus Latescibacterota bacterium]|jgi:modulator of FtsH protease HflC